MSQADLSSPRGTRLGVAVLVAALHFAAILALIHAFAPRITEAVAERVTSVFTVEISPPPKSPPPPPAGDSEPAGAAAEAGKRAVPREATASKPRVVIGSPKPAAPVPGKDDDVASGAHVAGQGSGAGGQGAGTGSGIGGAGQGGGLVTRLERVAGNIDSTRDYPRAGRAARQGDFVTINITVDAQGNPQDCRVVRPSRDGEADRITCQLAVKRFRFRPRSDAAGNRIPGIYQWTQRWWAPRQKD